MQGLMRNKKKVDVIVIGGGPIGSYFAGQMGFLGHTVNVFEKRKRHEVRKELGYIHFDVPCYNKLSLPRPDTASRILQGTFHENWQIPLTEEHKFQVPCETDILSMNGFSRWIARHAESSGNVIFHYESSFLRPVTEGSRVVGAEIGGRGEVFAGIVVDCTGREAVVRNSLPRECGVSPLVARPLRTFTLHMERWRCHGSFPRGSNTYVCYKGFANQVGPSDTLVGLSTFGDMKHTRAVHREFASRHLAGIDHDVTSVYSGTVPFDFPPASLVGDGFVSLGDAAFQNKPFNGEGIASGMEAARIAAPIIAEALRQGAVMRKSLWGYNSAYFRGVGAGFAKLRGICEMLVDLSPREFDWLYRMKFITRRDVVAAWLKQKPVKGPLEIVRMTLNGLRNRELFKRLIDAFRLGASLGSLYRIYPLIPSRIENWESRLDAVLLRHGINLHGHRAV
jgi:flavin-dependent dehydrogenase